MDEIEKKTTEGHEKLKEIKKIHPRITKKATQREYFITRNEKEFRE